MYAVRPFTVYQVICAIDHVLVKVCCQPQTALIKTFGVCTDMAHVWGAAILIVKALVAGAKMRQN